uniref:Uncharacterized protein n=1 Tax=Solanum tuberosum TaxID=4113 RepID=M1BHL6_SOLTU
MINFGCGFRQERSILLVDFTKELILQDFVYMIWVHESKVNLRKKFELKRFRIRKRDQQFIRHTWGGPGASPPHSAKEAGAARLQCAQKEPQKVGGWRSAPGMRPDRRFSPVFRHSVRLSLSKVF